MSIRSAREGNVIAWLIDGVITNDRGKLLAAIELGEPVRLITDVEAKLMAAFGCGPRWEALARLPVVFTTDQLASERA